MTPVRLGAVGYLNARPLVFGLDRCPRFTLRYDLPSECARLLHAGDIDLGLIPSIEYLRGDSYRIVPELAIASRGPVAIAPPGWNRACRVSSYAARRAGSRSTSHAAVTALARAGSASSPPPSG